MPYYIMWSGQAHQMEGIQPWEHTGWPRRTKHLPRHHHNPCDWEPRARNYKINTNQSSHMHETNHFSTWGIVKIQLRRWLNLLYLRCNIVRGPTSRAKEADSLCANNIHWLLICQQSHTISLNCKNVRKKKREMRPESYGFRQCTQSKIWNS